jgi:TPR repeat protein
MGNLAILLDAGVGGPADPKRAEELRAEVKKMNDPHFIHQVTDNPETLAMKASWLSGHFEEAIAGARSRADQGDAHAQAMLGRAYFEGLGVRRDLGEAKHWLDLAVAQNEPDGMFFLGLMYEHGWGVPADEPRGLKLFDRAAALGQHYADMEAKGMRMQMELNKPEYQPKHGVMDTACGVAGGISVGFECIRGGSTIDPFAPWQNESN